MAGSTSFEGAARRLEVMERMNAEGASDLRVDLSKLLGTATGWSLTSAYFERALLTSSLLEQMWVRYYLLPEWDSIFRKYFKPLSA